MQSKHFAGIPLANVPLGQLEKHSNVLYGLPVCLLKAVLIIEAEELYKIENHLFTG
jgi:hypothetical protein